MAKELALLVAFFALIGMVVSGPLRDRLPEPVRAGIQRLVDAARVNIQGPTPVGR